MSQPQPTARRQIDFLKRQAGFIILVTVVTLVAAALASFTQAKVYRAETNIVVGQAGGIFQPQFGNVFQPFTQTMSSLLKSDIVANTVIRDLGLDETPKSLLSHVDVSSTPNSAVLQVTFESEDRAYAVRTLRRMASVFTSLVEEKLGGTPRTTGAAGALPPITATVFDPAHASSTPVSPRPARTLAFAGIIGLALGLVLALLRDALDDRLRGRDDVEEHFGAPIVAALPQSMLGRTREIVPSSLRAVEPLRLQLSGNGSRGTVVVITSSASGEGTSTVAANLGVALSLAGQDVICVDADPTPPRLTDYLELQQPDGNVSATQNRADLAGSLRDVEARRGAERLNAEAETAAHPLGGPADESRTADLDSAADGKPVTGRPGRIQLLVWGDEQEGLPNLTVDDLAAELKARAAYVVVDAPPLPSGTTLALLSIADETIVVTRAKKTKKAQATFVRQTLERLHVRNYSIVSFEGPEPSAFRRF